MSKNKKSKIKINEIRATRYKDFKLDPNGYFVINVTHDRISADFYSRGKMKFRICGHTGREIRDTVDRLKVFRQKFPRTIQHAIYLGLELQKAELALNYGLEYEQDEALEIPFKNQKSFGPKSLRTRSKIKYKKYRRR
ncbi:MAG: hypothetical protein V1843_02010 [bacterium]